MTQLIVCKNMRFDMQTNLAFSVHRGPPCLPVQPKKSHVKIETVSQSDSQATKARNVIHS